MGIKVPLPKDQWAEICEPEDITRRQKNTYQGYIDKAFYPDGDGRVTYVPDPDNPAVMLPAEPRRARLTADTIASMQEMVYGWCITGWSYDFPVSAESLGKVPAMALDMIEAALSEHGHYDVLNGAGPKETTETEPTSSATSPDTAAASLPE